MDGKETVQNKATKRETERQRDREEGEGREKERENPNLDSSSRGCSRSTYYLYIGTKSKLVQDNCPEKKNCLEE